MAMDQTGLRRLLAALGMVGVVLCAVSGAARLFGVYTIAGVGSQSVMIGGIALMVAAVYAKQFFVDRSA